MADEINRLDRGHDRRGMIKICEYYKISPLGDSHFNSAAYNLDDFYFDIRKSDNYNLNLCNLMIMT